MPNSRLLGLLAAAMTIVPAAPALAGPSAPATVSVRVEGKARTLYEGTVTTDVRTFKFTGDPTTHVCDGTSANGGASTVPAPTAGGALATAAEQAPFSTAGTWYDGIGPAFSSIAGDDVSFDAGTGSFLAEYYNGVYQTAVGACGQPVKTGDSYLFAYSDGTAPALALAGPATAKPGATVALKVTDADVSLATPIAGATVGGQTTDADGVAQVVVPQATGPVSFKASKTGTIRSNRFDVCVTSGSDGACGTTTPGAAPGPASVAPPVPLAPDTAAAFAKVRSITEGRHFFHGAAPRLLQGTVDPEPAGIKDVRLRLARTDGKRCSRYDGVRERFVATRHCGIVHAASFSVGTSAAFSYLLPATLPHGRYVLDVIVRDRAGHQTTTYERGRNRVVFFVG